ncbi:MAG: hypothetical protein IT326_05905 [Anaerolineae bacterium]|nr:hypothetical protein [Anaerolineae bacterium]
MTRFTPTSVAIRRCAVVIAGSLLALVLVLIPAEARAQDEDEGLTSPDECATCHEAEYNEWAMSEHFDALTDPIFIEASIRAGNPTYCRSCHATGYRPVNGTVQYEGVSCQACHPDPNGEHPMNPAITVDKSAELCGTCHTGPHAPSYEQWFESGHAAADITCADCHQSHNTTLRMEDTDQMCLSCHKGMDTNLHTDGGTSCTDCHMAPGTEIIDVLSGQTDGAGHTFAIKPETCAECHGDSHHLTVASADEGAEAASVTPAEGSLPAQTAEIAANTQLNLGLTGGGIGGLILGLTIPWLFSLRSGGKNDETH